VGPSTYLSDLLVFLFDKLELMLHLVLKLDHKLFGYGVTDCSLRELIGGSTFGFTVDFSKFLVEEGSSGLEAFGEGSLESFIGLLLGSLTLALTDVAPGCFDVWDDSSVDGLHIGTSEVV
jgi:hypothetical protein